MIKQIDYKKFIFGRKLGAKLFFLILITALFCLSLFRFLWHKKWNVYYFLAENLPSSLQFLPLPDDDFWAKLDAEAVKYDIPSSENDKKSIDALKPFFSSLADEYTGIYIYGLEDGLYRAGYEPEAMLWNGPFNAFFNMTYRWIDNEIDRIYQRPIKFRNGYALTNISFYHSSFFIAPYGVFCLFLCIFLFLAIILFFVGRKLKHIVRLQQNILQMSSGDLITPIPHAGFDEIGILSLELDNLRRTLHETIQKEQSIRKSNQELIAALSHDLRTPLTILKGYLEIVRLNRNPDMQTEYVKRCLQKTEDIQEMTDRMFEYALVYDEAADDTADIRLLKIPFEFLLDTLKEHSDFLCLAGFETKLHIMDINDPSDSKFIADPAMVKRIFNNLFSNIIKYADKKGAVEIFISSNTNLIILLKNSIKKEYENIESTQIGLKSVQKMTEHMNGRFLLEKSDRFFTVELRFPIS